MVCLMIQTGDFWTSNVGKMAIARIIERGNTYWRQNVYKHYDRHTGQLGNASMVTFTGGKFRVIMKPMIDLETGREYSRAIKRGISPGVGAYDPKLGKRKHTGFYPGVSTSKFWNPWMREFRPAFKQIVREEVRLATKMYVKQAVRGKA